MAFPTRGQVYGLYLQILDDPGGAVFTDTPNSTTGAVSVFQSGFSQAYDLLFQNALNQQIPLVETVVQGIVAGPSPVPFSMTPAAMGLPDFADFEWIAERTLGSNDKFLDLVIEDRLTQRSVTDRLLETVYQDGAFNFVGCSSVRELQIKYVFSSAGAPTNNAIQVVFDGSLNFLANYAAGVTGGQKGYDETARRCLSFAVGPKFDLGSIGGELFRLMQPLVRSRQDVQVAHKPYTTQRRIGGRWRGVPYVASQAGTTGGGSQNSPVQYSTSNGTIVGAVNGINSVFVINVGTVSYTVFVNGVFQTAGVDYNMLGNQFTFTSGSIPQPGSIVSANVYPAYQN